MPLPQSESRVALLGVSTSAWPAPIDVPDGSAAVQELFVGSPNCQPLRFTAEEPELYNSTQSRLAPPFCGLYIISLSITSARSVCPAKAKTEINRSFAIVFENIEC